MQSKIQIAIACGINSEKYTEFLIKTIERTVSSGNDIEYILGVSHRYVDKNYLDNIQTRYPLKIIEMLNGFKNRNRGHALALDELFKHFDSEYGMFIDCDVAMLSRDWDIKMQKHFINNIVIVGGEYFTGKGKYRNFPTATFCMFKTDILKKIGISFMPLSFTHKDKIVIDAEQAGAFGLNQGDAIVIDTGWELPFKIKKNGYEGHAMSALIFKDDASKFAKDFGGYEYQMDGEVIATHIGRSSKNNFMTHPLAVKWWQGVEWWLNKELG